LMLSSFLGIIIGDCAELEALRLVGARRVLVVASIKPLAAALFGFFFLNEPLYVPGIIGMILSAYGVYIVLMASLESIQKERDKKKRASLKRLGSSGKLVSSNDGVVQYNKGRKDYFDEDTDAEVASINAELPENKIKMIGMRRRPLSRHDISAEYDDVMGTAGKEDDVFMMLMEDGRGIVDTSVCCNSSSSSDENGLRRRASSGSWGNTSWGEMGSDHQFDLHMMTKGESFKEEDVDDLGYFFGTDAPIAGVEKKAMQAQEAMKRDQLVSISLPPPKEKLMKSSLRKSRFGGQIEMGGNRKDMERKQLTKSQQKLQQPHRSIVSASTYSSSHSHQLYGTNEHVALDNKKEKESFRPSLSRCSSSNSIISIDSECGPPLGFYYDNKKETGLQRLIRLRTGYFLATLNVLLDAYGSYLTKKHGVGLSTWEINLCRMGFAGFVMICISAFMQLIEYQNHKRNEQQLQSMRSSSHNSDRKNDLTKWYKLPQMSIVPWTIVSIGVFFVTFLCPALVNYALFQIPLALAISLTATTPLYTIPLSFIMKGHIPTKKSCIGVFLSVCGVFILCMWGVNTEL